MNKGAFIADVAPVTFPGADDPIIKLELLLPIEDRSAKCSSSIEDRDSLEGAELITETGIPPTLSLSRR